jgi:hypothetical protein
MREVAGIPICAPDETLKEGFGSGYGVGVGVIRGACQA